MILIQLYSVSFYSVSLVRRSLLELAQVRLSLLECFSSCAFRRYRDIFHGLAPASLTCFCKQWQRSRKVLVAVEGLLLLKGPWMNLQGCVLLRWYHLQAALANIEGHHGKEPGQTSHAVDTCSFVTPPFALRAIFQGRSRKPGFARPYE